MAVNAGFDKPVPASGACFRKANKEGKTTYEISDLDAMISSTPGGL